MTTLHTTLSCSLFFLSSPNLSRRRLDVYHTSTHDVALVWIYTVSQKKRPTFTTCYNFYIHSSIATIFGTNVAEKVGNQTVLYFPPHLTSASALPGETENLEIASFHLNAACFFIKNTKHSLKYHLVRAEPPFAVKTIEWEQEDSAQVHCVCVTPCKWLKYVIFVFSPFAR